ncbi:MAG: MFS transporter [Dermatophilus congolensis]|nr:MFS transporter [Dermatophilus congolensis]
MPDPLPAGGPAEPAERRSRTPRVHRAFVVALVTLGALVAAAAFRSSTGVLFVPIEEEFGWSRSVTSGAVSLNLVIYGLTAPFAAAIMERWGVRRTVALSLLVVGVASALTTVMTAPWQLWLLWGVFVGVGTGAMALVLGAIVANRWFVTHRGLVVGIFSAANATGQLIFLPSIAALADGPGWRAAALTVAGLSLVLVPLVLWQLIDHPEHVGARPYGELQVAGDVPLPDTNALTEQRSPLHLAIGVLRRASRSWVFWALMLTFWVCGWTTNGLVQTHFIPAAHDHGMPATTAAGLLALVGAFDILGTVASGWLTDRVDARLLLLAYYALRGLSLLVLPSILAPDVQPALWVFIIFYGLDWVATVPPTVALCRQHFGLEASGIVFGWVFASHMVGAGVGASVAGLIRSAHGDYRLAWLFAGALCLAASALALTIPRRPKELAVVAS